VIETAVQSVTERLRQSGLGERMHDVLPPGRAAA
jgi:hypothetical protein